MTTAEHVALRLLGLLVVFLALGFGFIPLLDMLWRRYAVPPTVVYPCTTWWSPYWPSLDTNEPPYSIGIACSPPRQGWVHAARCTK